MKTYHARAQRSDGWWALDVPDVRGAHAQVRRLDQAEEAIREAIAFVVDVPEDSFLVEVEPVLEAFGELVTRAVEARATAETMQRTAAAQTTEATARLLEAGLTVRDVAHLLGISYQRVAQLSHKRQS